MAATKPGLLASSPEETKNHKTPLSDIFTLKNALFSFGVGITVVSLLFFSSLVLTAITVNAIAFVLTGVAITFFTAMSCAVHNCIEKCKGNTEDDPLLPARRPRTKPAISSKPRYTSQLDTILEESPSPETNKKSLENQLRCIFLSTCRIIGTLAIAPQPSAGSKKQITSAQNPEEKARASVENQQTNEEPWYSINMAYYWIRITSFSPIFKTVQPLIPLSTTVDRDQNKRCSTQTTPARHCK